MSQLIFKLHFWLLCLVILTTTRLNAQNGFENSPLYKHIVTVGGSVGPAHYIGDLSPKLNLSFLRPSVQVYAKKTLFAYDISFKMNYNYSFLTAADKYSRDSIQLKRNLDFSTSVHEVSLSMQAGLIKFRRYNKVYSLYMSLGMGYFFFNPYSFEEGSKVYLRNLGTEGQFSYLPVKANPYSLQGISFPFGLGIQSNKKSVKTWHLEFIYRFTKTGYLDDVFSEYAGFESFQSTSNSYNSVLASKMQNRSEQIDFGIRGSSRGNGKADHYFTVNFGIDLQLWRYVYKFRTKYNRIKINQKVSVEDDLW